MDYKKSMKEKMEEPSEHKDIEWVAPKQSSERRQKSKSHKNNAKSRPKKR